MCVRAGQFTTVGAQLVMVMVSVSNTVEVLRVPLLVPVVEALPVMLALLVTTGAATSS